MTIGERTAWVRRRRGLSQEVLAGLVGRTTDWLSKVENGRANLDRLSVIKALADALDVTVGDLLGEPSLVEWPTNAPQRTVSLLRESLMDYPSLTNSLPDVELLPSHDLRSEVEGAWNAYQASRFGHATTILPKVLAAARAGSHNGGTSDERREAQRMLALSYHAASATLGKVGETELAWIAADRGLVAAEETEDILVIASLLRSVTHAMISAGRYDYAASLVSRAADRFGGTTVSEDQLPTWLSITGTLFLTGAMAAARADQPGEARAFLARARQAGASLGHDANHAWTAFGPTNVAVHDVSVAMEIGDVQVALAHVPRVDVRNLPIERRVRHSLEVARVYSRVARPDDAIATLLQAERESPEQVRHHYLARELVLAWIRNRNTRRLNEVDALAQRLRLA